MIYIFYTIVGSIICAVAQVTGMAATRRGAARMQPSVAMVYVAEITTGNVAAYAVPWSKGDWAAGRMIGPMPLARMAVTKFRAAAAGGAPAGGP